MVDVKDPKVQYRTTDGWVDALTGTVTPVLQFPTATSVGVYAAVPDWEPTTTVADLVDYSILDSGVYENLRFVNTPVYVRAPHVTFRHCEFIGGFVNNAYAGVLYNDMLIEDCTFQFDPPGHATHPLTAPGSYPSIAAAGYTARRCALIDVNEGFRGGDQGSIIADPTVSGDPRQIRIYDCYAHVIGPDDCEFQDWHGDALQFYDGSPPMGGGPARLRNVTLYLVNEPPTIETGIGCVGSSCILAFPNDLTYLDIDRVLCSGGSTSCDIGCPADIRNLYIEDNAGYFGELDISDAHWPLIGAWSAWACTIGGDGQPTATGSYPRGYRGGPLDPP